MKNNTKQFFRSLMLIMLLAMATEAKAISEKVTIKGALGQLQAVIQRPDAASSNHRVPLVVICHGFMGNKNASLLTDIADKLEKQGIASLRFDFNGHGESEGDFVKMTVLNEIEDARCVVSYARSLPYVKNVSIAGHSQGGVVSAMLAGQLGKQIKAVALLAPAGVLRDDALKGFLFGKVYDPYNNLPESVELWGKYSLGIDYVRTAQTLPIYETARQYRGSVCVVHGTHDTVVPYTYGQRFAYVMRRSQIHLIEKADHGFSQHQQEAVSLVVDFLVNTLK